MRRHFATSARKNWWEKPSTGKFLTFRWSVAILSLNYWQLGTSSSFVKTMHITLSSVKDGAWIPYHDHHLSIQSHAEICKGMPPKAAPKRPPQAHPQTRVEQATMFTCTVNVHTPKDHLFALGGPSHRLMQVAKSQEWLALISPSLGAPSFSTIPLDEFHHEQLTSTRSSLGANLEKLPKNASHNHHTFHKHLEDSNQPR